MANKQNLSNSVRKEYAKTTQKYIDGMRDNYSSAFVDLFQARLLHNCNESVSLGVLFLLINSLSDTDYNKNKFDLAVTIEVLFSVSNLMDDIIDSDNKENLPTNELLINNLSLLFNTLQRLYGLTQSTLDFAQILQFLNLSIEGETFDFYSSLTKFSTIEDYFSKMLKKSTGLIQLTCYIACPTLPGIWHSFAENLGNAFQILDDAIDSINIAKADIKQFKETLPIIKATEYANRENNTLITDIINHHKQDSSSLILLAEYIKNSGALEYSLNVSTLYAEKAFQILRNVFDYKKLAVAQIIDYIREGVQI
ncbi:MAG: polyprenyl synthetase family protein [Lactobacillus sp.]|nr:polyprenyl synthetase family protein [Lactobacillus sp.]